MQLVLLLERLELDARTLVKLDLLAVDGSDLHTLPRATALSQTGPQSAAVQTSRCSLTPETAALPRSASAKRFAAVRPGAA